MSLLYCCVLFHQKHYNQLREEFSKMKPPEGLEDVDKGDIDPKGKQYSTDQSGASGSTPQIVPADSNANSMLAQNLSSLVSDSDINGIASTANC